LKLKPLSQITDEDLKFIYSDKKINVEIDEDVYLSKKLANFVESDIYLTDYLRSKGYAVPFMEYSVEDLVSLGWVRLDQQKTICFDCGKKDLKKVEEKVVTARLAVCDICKKQKLTTNTRHYE